MCRPFVFAWLALCALALAGCGSDRGGGTPRGDTHDVVEPVDASRDAIIPLDADDGASGPEDADENDAGCDTIGCPCADDEDCASGYCVDGGAAVGRICSELCSGACPLPDYDCVVLINSGGDAVQLCVPSAASYCEPCATDRNCGRLGDVCLTLDDGQHCAPDCSSISGCPPGGSCVDVTVAGQVRELCVPDLGVCSACADADVDGFGVGAACRGGDCDDDDDATYEGAPELCDQVDNDCDLFVDEDFDLAADASNCGACGVSCAAAHASSVCVEGTCALADCEPGWSDCDRDVATGCERSDAELTACGGCATLPASPGDACGTCDTGTWTCAGTDEVACAGDGGSAALNVCGGCGILPDVPGAPCGTCGTGSFVCDGREASTCVGDRGLAALNACGGCAPLAESPGAPCGTCDTGTWTCEGSDALGCSGDAGAAALNACGGCAVLVGTRGQSCGTCGSGALECIGPDALGCRGDGGAGILNACGGCTSLPESPGTPCGTCSSGTIACDGPDITTCVGDRGATALNACGGCSTLSTVPGTSCGPCGDGVRACSGADAVVCSGATPDSDGDTICDNNDRCSGHDDRIDGDFDTVPDGCDRCSGFDDRQDADFDRTPDGCDRCSVGSDLLDVDGDGRPDACDCDLAGCGAGASCTESASTPVCACLPGYAGDGRACTPVDCGAPAAPIGGSVSYTSTTFGSTATVSCRAGWTLSGASSRTCQSTGAWSAGGACTHPNQIWCACGGNYAVGDRVAARVDWVAFPNSAGQALDIGDLGTVVGGGSTGYPLLVLWDDFSGGNGVCGGALQCGQCTGSGSRRYWVLCNDVQPAP